MGCKFRLSIYEIKPEQDLLGPVNAETVKCVLGIFS